MGLKKDIKKYLKEKQSPLRYKHILGVQKTAKKMGEKFYDKSLGISKSKFLFKLEIAALLHDVDKGRDYDYMWNKINNSKIKKAEKDIIKKNKEIFHAFSASITAYEKFGIYDEDILSAVRYHTTGKKNMSIYDKIIYLADFIEPNRDFTKVDYFRNLAFIDLDKCLFESFEYSIKYLKDKNSKVSQLTLEARDYLKNNMVKRKQWGTI